MARPTTLSRRAFLGSTAAGMALGAFGRGSSAYQGPSHQPGPNNQVVLGMIGVGSMGMGRLRDFMEEPDTRIAAI